MFTAYSIASSTGSCLSTIMPIFSYNSFEMSSSDVQRRRWKIHAFHVRFTLSTHFDSSGISFTHCQTKRNSFIFSINFSLLSKKRLLHEECRAKSLPVHFPIPHAHSQVAATHSMHIFQGTRLGRKEVSQCHVSLLPRDERTEEREGERERERTRDRLVLCIDLYILQFTPICI